MKTKSISIEQYSLLDDAYCFFNKHLFKGELPDVMIVLHRKKNSKGYFHAERFAEKVAKKKKVRASFDELALNPDDFERPDITILSTLVHEMAHVWRYRCSDKEPSRGGYHDKLWANKMDEIGLTPKAIGKNGELTDKKTGQKVTHEIVLHGKFETCCLEFLKGKAIKLSSFPELPKEASTSNKNKIKYSCSCEVNIWAKPGIKVSCDECGESFVEA